MCSEMESSSMIEDDRGLMIEDRLYGTYTIRLHRTKNEKNVLRKVRVRVTRNGLRNGLNPAY